MRTHSPRTLVLALLISSALSCQSSGSGPDNVEAIPIPVPPAADTFPEADQLRGSITPERAWWDLLHYDLRVEFIPETKTLLGSNTIQFVTLASGIVMQIDLQEPLKITSVLFRDRELEVERNGSVHLIRFPWTLGAGVRDQIKVSYEGIPVESKNPPWSGGISWKTDEKGAPFIATTCQGIGASIWWPCKDHGYDEPNQGMDIHVSVPESLVAVANGRLMAKDFDPVHKLNMFHWRVTNPINNYAVNANIGNYVSMDTSYKGENGKLDIQYWVLPHQVEAATEQFKQAPRTIEAFEHWFGPYPFYEDSFKLVVVPYLGMEHQSSVTYGNGFKNGYRGRDLSGTGEGLLFDYIIIHEAAHEWFGNNISHRDSADMWIHEAFATYAENLYLEYHFSEEQAQNYVIGSWKKVRNNKPIIGPTGVNKTGSGDMYAKGAAMLHTLRHALNDTEKWREILRGLNEEFWHQTVSTAKFERYISQRAEYDFGPFFDQYLRTKEIPVLTYLPTKEGVAIWFGNVVQGFHMPILMTINGVETRLDVGQDAIQVALESPFESLELDRNFYLTSALYAPEESAEEATE
ncbi:MAG: aminopeptidase N [Glaciecola sp.]|jgi:aminopeptidase N